MLIMSLWSNPTFSDICHLNIFNTLPLYLYLFMRASNVVEHHSTIAHESHEDVHQHFIYSHTVLSCHRWMNAFANTTIQTNFNFFYSSAL